MNSNTQNNVAAAAHCKTCDNAKDNIASLLLLARNDATDPRWSMAKVEDLRRMLKKFGYRHYAGDTKAECIAKHKGYLVVHGHLDAIPNFVVPEVAYRTLLNGQAAPQQPPQQQQQQQQQQQPAVNAASHPATQPDGTLSLMQLDAYIQRPAPQSIGTASSTTTTTTPAPRVDVDLTQQDDASMDEGLPQSIEMDTTITAPPQYYQDECGMWHVYYPAPQEPQILPANGPLTDATNDQVSANPAFDPQLPTPAPSPEHQTWPHDPNNFNGEQFSYPQRADSVVQQGEAAPLPIPGQQYVGQEYGYTPEGMREFFSAPENLPVPEVNMSLGGNFQQGYSDGGMGGYQFDMPQFDMSDLRLEDLNHAADPNFAVDPSIPMLNSWV